MSITTPKVNHHRLPPAMLASRKQKCFIIEIIEHLLLLFCFHSSLAMHSINFTPSSLPSIDSLSLTHFIHSMIDAFTWKCFLSAHANVLFTPALSLSLFLLLVGGVLSLLLLLSKCVHIKLRVYRSK